MEALLADRTLPTDAPPADAALLELHGVHAGYGPIEVLHGVDLPVLSGAVVTLLGPNGAGKSTALKVCAGLLAPTSGEVRLAGQVVNAARAVDRARLGVCMIPEGRGVFANLTVREHIWLAARTRGRVKEAEETTYELFPRLRERAAQRAGTLSGGEQQMLSVARAFITRPAVLLVDELSAGLAPLVATELYALVSGMARQGVAVLVVEQRAKMALGIADYAAVMVHGKVVAFRRPAELEGSLAGTYLRGPEDAARAAG